MISIQSHFIYIAPFLKNLPSKVMEKHHVAFVKYTITGHVKMALVQNLQQNPPV